MVLPPLKYISTPYFLQMFLQLSLMPCMYGTIMWGFLVLVLLFLLVPCLFFFLFCVMLTLFNAHIGYLHLLKTLLR